MPLPSTGSITTSSLGFVGSRFIVRVAAFVTEVAKPFTTSIVFRLILCRPWQNSENRVLRLTDSAWGNVQKPGTRF